MIPILAAALLGAGLFLSLCDIRRVPTLRTAGAVTVTIKRQKQKDGMLQRWRRDLAAWLAKRLRLNEYKRLQLEADLHSADLSISPELHIAQAVVGAVPVGLLAIPALFIFPLLAPLVIAIAFLLYFKAAKGIQERIKERRAAIEYDLPRLTHIIEQTLKHNRDVLSILDHYREAAGPELRKELTITVADMRSGNYEAALTRLEARVDSSLLSDVTRGLIGVLRGDDTALYWPSLSLKMADIQRQRLKQEAQKVPGKIKRLSMCLLFSFVSVYMVVIISQILTSLGAMFG